MKKKNTLITFIAVILIFSGILYAQQGPVKRMMAPPSGESRIISPDGIATFLFEFISNHIVLPVEINGVKVKLILDTGMPFDGVVLFGNLDIDKLNLPFTGKAQVKSGTDEATIMADLAMGINFKIPGVEFSGQMVMVMPNDGNAEGRREGVDGVIGNSIFSHYVVSINYDNMKITLMNPDQFDYSAI